MDVYTELLHMYSTLLHFSEELAMQAKGPDSSKSAIEASATQDMRCH